MLICGIHSKYNAYYNNDNTSEEIYNNIMLINAWNTNIRYKKINYITEEQVEKLIEF
jgi:ADP-dependent phosphofructokinase/glucokinase